MPSLNPTVKCVNTNASAAFYGNAVRRFSLCQSVFDDSSPTRAQQQNRINPTLLLLTLVDKPNVEETKPKLSLYNWAHRQSSNWLQCTFTKWPNLEYTQEANLLRWTKPNYNETTSWLRFVCQLTVSRPVNSLCKVLFQLSLTVLVCYRCRSRIMRSLTSSLPRTLSCTLKQLDSNKFEAPLWRPRPQFVVPMPARYRAFTRSGSTTFPSCPKIVVICNLPKSMELAC